MLGIAPLAPLRFKRFCKGLNHGSGSDPGGDGLLSGAGQDIAILHLVVLSPAPFSFERSRDLLGDAAPAAQHRFPASSNLALCVATRKSSSIYFGRKLPPLFLA